MNRHGKPLASVLAAALLLSGVAAGCSRTGPATAGTFAPSPAAASMAPDASLAEIAGATVPGTDSVSPTPASTETNAAPSTAAGLSAGPTVDPLDGELQSVNQLLNGIDSSISGSSAGGE